MSSTNIKTRSGKRKFIRDLCNNVRDDLLGKVALMPDDWDGNELREYISDKFTQSAYVKMSRKQYAAYRNSIATTNL